MSEQGSHSSAEQSNQENQSEQLGWWARLKRLASNSIVHLLLLSGLIAYLYQSHDDIFVLVVQFVSIFLISSVFFALIHSSVRFYQSKERLNFNSSISASLQSIFKSNSNLFYLAIVFYGGLLFVVATTGWVLRNEWAILSSAIAPLVIYLLLQMLPNIRRSRLTEFEAGVSGIKLKFDMSQGNSLTGTSTFKLSLDDARTIRKGVVKEIKFIIENLRQAGRSPRVLVIPLTSNISTRDTSEYIRAISDNFSTFRYLVFVEEITDKYKGFMKAKDFDLRYPLPEFDILFGFRKENVQWLQDQFDNLAENNEDISNFLDVLRRMKAISDDSEARQTIKRAIQARRRARLTEDSLEFMNAVTKPLKEPTVLEAFMALRNAGSGLPVVDNDDRFIGVVEYEDILSQLILQTAQN
jgi:hypothetical protein